MFKSQDFFKLAGGATVAAAIAFGAPVLLTPKTANQRVAEGFAAFIKTDKLQDRFPIAPFVPSQPALSAEVCAIVEAQATVAFPPPDSAVCPASKPVLAEGQ